MLSYTIYKNTGFCICKPRQKYAVCNIDIKLTNNAVQEPEGSIQLISCVENKL
jgi:hypothetical protein